MEAVLKNPIKSYIDKKNATLTSEEIQKREEMAQILTKELEMLMGHKEDKHLYKYSMDYKHFNIDKGIYITLLMVEILVYLILGLMETILSQRVVVIIPYLCMTIPMFCFIFKLFHVISMVEVMTEKKYNGIVNKINKYSKVMLFFGVIMLICQIFLLCNNIQEVIVQKEVFYMIFIIISCITSFVLSVHTIRFKRKMTIY